MTAPTQQTNGQDVSGWVLFDGECSACVSLARRFAPTLRGRRFLLVPQQTPWVRARVGLADGERPSEMLVLTPAGTIVGGADAVVLLAKWIWWARPLHVLAKSPGMMRLLRLLYRLAARHRHLLGKCSNAACSVPDHRE